MKGEGRSSPLSFFLATPVNLYDPKQYQKQSVRIQVDILGNIVPFHLLFFSLCSFYLLYFLMIFVVISYYISPESFFFLLNKGARNMAIFPKNRKIHFQNLGAMEQVIRWNIRYPWTSHFISRFYVIFSFWLLGNTCK